MKDLPQITRAFAIISTVAKNPGVYTKKMLAEKFGVHVDTISNVFDHARAAGIDIVQHDARGTYVAANLRVRASKKERIEKTILLQRPKDNEAILEQRRRSKSAYYARKAGVPNRNIRLSNEKVRELIRKRESGVKLRVLAAEYGISVSTVSMICSRRSRQSVIL